MMRWRAALRRKVVDTTSAETIGAVSALVMDPHQKRVTAVVIAGPDAPVVDFDNLAGFGKDAVTLEGQDHLRAPDGEREEKSISGDLDPLGKEVLDEDGDLLGSVADIDFDGTSGEIVQIILADDHLSPRRLIGLGSFAMTVSARGRSADPAGELSDLLKSELYEMASERDIDGRSTMSKAELIDALR